MRLTVLLFASVMVVAGPAAAQEWDQFASPSDGFKVDFPGTPTVTESTFESEYGAKLPARIFRASRGAERYVLTVADYNQAPKLLDEKAKALCPKDYADERSCGLSNAGRGYWKEDMGGALLWATYGFLKRDVKLTHLAYAWQDLVEGNEIQLTNNADQSRTFAFVTMHRNKLYILEATVPKGYPAPGLFQQSMGFVDPDGNGVRYQSIYSNMYSEFPDVFPGQPKRTGQGGGPGAGAPGAGAAPAGRGGTPPAAGR